jgi:hypothetical protein
MIANLAISQNRGKKNRDFIGLTYLAPFGTTPMKDPLETTPYEGPFDSQIYFGLCGPFSSQKDPQN